MIIRAMKSLFWRKTSLILSLVVVLAFLLRLFLLGKIPLSLYWDEASLGFNAYSISQTLRDEHGTFLPVSNFVAFGDFKAPGYIYLDALVVKILGFVRVFGSLTICTSWNRISSSDLFFGCGIIQK